MVKLSRQVCGGFVVVFVLLMFQLGSTRNESYTTWTKESIQEASMVVEFLAGSISDASSRNLPVDFPLYDEDDDDTEDEVGKNAEAATARQGQPRGTTRLAQLLQHQEVLPVTNRNRISFTPVKTVTKMKKMMMKRKKLPLLPKQEPFGRVKVSPLPQQQQDEDRPALARHPYKFSSPVFVLSLPKSGTTSLSAFFKCGGLRAPHTFGKDEESGTDFRLGACLYANFQSDRPLLQGCRPDHYHAYSDIGTLGKQSGMPCFYPSIDALDQIARDYPNATLIVSYRSDWYQAAKRWNNIHHRWQKRCPQFPNTTRPDEWDAFYQQHQQRIRNLVQTHPTLHYLEFNLTDPTAGAQLQAFTGIPARCWADCKPNKPCRPTRPLRVES